MFQEPETLASARASASRTEATAAVEAGFADPAHFSRAFLEQLGVTPGSVLAPGGQRVRIIADAGHGANQNGDRWGGP